jgi:hypothetical protein
MKWDAWEEVLNDQLGVEYIISKEKSDLYYHDIVKMIYDEYGPPTPMIS